MKKLQGLVLASFLAATAGACSYAGVATSGEYAVVSVNDGLLFGLLRKVYVCKVTPAGLQECNSQQNP